MISKFFYILPVMLMAFILDGYSKSGVTKNGARQEYINRYTKLAIKEMNEFAIPASIILAQACLESGDGNSQLSRNSNNHFGIKCKSNWTGERVYHDDDEKDECFRKYDTPTESFRDHSKFLLESTRYKFLFDYNIRDYKQWAYGLKRAGYATNPKYPEMLIKIIEDYNLNELDRYYKSDGTRHGWFLFGSGSRNKTIYTDRKVEQRNGRNAFFAKDGDTYENMAVEFALKEEDLLKYNDCQKGSEPELNDVVYLQHKKGKAPRGNDYHVAKQNESLWSIAQWYGVRLNSLYRLNKMKKGQEPYPGQVISLRKRI
jgi:hypothetical protein